MDALLDVPVLGLILQLAAYLVQVAVTNGSLILILAAPLALGALCGFMNERSGIVNIGIEGMMLSSAFMGWGVASLVGQILGPTPAGPLFGTTPAILAGLLAALLTGVAVSAVHAWLSISVRADQIISGTIINIAAFGLTGYLNLLISRGAPPGGGKFVPFEPPGLLVDLPLVGWLFRALLEQGPITMSALILAVIMQILLFRSRWGLRTRAVGEHPRAAETVGVDVVRLRYRNVLTGGLFAGLAGAWFTLDFGGTFEAGMTNGRGFIALAALIFGRWTPLGAFGAALLFAASGALGTAIRNNPPAGQLGNLLGAIPENAFQALPYLVTIIVLAGVVGRSIPPAAVGRPYERESAT